MLKTPVLSRRAALAALSLPAVSALSAARAAPVADAAPPRDVCLLTPQSIEGPFYLDPRLVRAKIAEGRAGVPLRVDLRVMDGATCKPNARARVDIWHADARGIYSGYQGQGDKQDLSTVGQTFLRGTQFADGKGAVRFETIYPGWYEGRATHIHFKVLLEDRNVLTGQMYFPDAVNEFIYANIPAYGERLNPRAVVNANDRFATFDDPNRLSFCAIKEERECYAVSLVLGVDRSAVAKAKRPPPQDDAPPRPAVERTRMLIPGLI
ncbi:intradiol ring-cleavage dioxygenase [Bradyrhizobium sp.]|jgi:protocatechuate 3,4-dioxygenase beta subunit|uniref:intradiol ring-cleavage dioxygenase n=1 Tax=Bradyrhizobium sp. TaxID=376 RepID=UPI002DF99F6B|nr:intradiol ring-cleavage dioxygenase [Bradyrhizobium sp.]